jgi:hypothetical protein
VATNSVDICQSFEIVGPENPSLLRSIVRIENAETYGVRVVGPAPAPSLKGNGACPQCGFSVDLKDIGLRGGTTGLVTHL